MWEMWLCSTIIKFCKKFVFFTIYWIIVFSHWFTKTLTFRNNLLVEFTLSSTKQGGKGSHGNIYKEEQSVLVADFSTVARTVWLIVVKSSKGKFVKKYQPLEVARNELARRCNQSHITILG